MSANKNQPHLLVLPEDDANRQILNAFLLEFPTRQIQRLPEAGGWRKVLEEFELVHVRELTKYRHRSMLLLIDFDGQSGRLAEAQAKMPEELADRVFILGAWSDPEKLRSTGLGPFEQIGRAIATDCRHNTDATWGHDLLKHNKPELDRLCPRIREILFAST